MRAGRRTLSPFAGGVAALLAFARLAAVEGVVGSFLPWAVVVLTVLTALLPRLLVFSFGEEQRMASELGLATLRLAALLVAIDGALRLARERDRGGLGLLFARPAGPAAYAAGRALGQALLLALALLTLSAARALSLEGSWAAPGRLAEGAARALTEGAVLVAAGAMCGALLRPAAAALGVVALFLVGHLLPDGVAALERAGALGPAAAGLLSALVPDLGALGPSTGLRPDPGFGAALLLALPPIVAYLCVAFAALAARELGASGERS